MKKSVVIVLGVAVMALFALPTLAWDDVSHEEDVCWFDVPEWEDLLDVELEDQDCDDAWDDDEGGGEIDTWECGVAGGDRPYLICTYGNTLSTVTHHIVVGKTADSDEVMMCASTDGGLTWVRRGYVDRDYTTLKIYGNTAKDNIKIQRTAYYYSAICDFDAWFTSAEIAYLYMYGQGNYDVVSGSDNGDSHLEGETVNGYDGNDHITLTRVSGYTPSAAGGTGHDYIVGTNYQDWIWGGDGVYSDTIYGLDGDDELGGGEGDDTIYGGNGDDWIEGGSGDDTIYGDDDDDIIQGESGNDTLSGGDGCDYLYGGTGATDCCGTEGNGGYCVSGCEYACFGGCHGYCF